MRDQRVDFLGGERVARLDRSLARHHVQHVVNECFRVLLIPLSLEAIEEVAHELRDIRVLHQ